MSVLTTSSLHIYASYNNYIVHVYVRHTLFLLNVTGILAGMWPCGIVTLVDELYRAESKTQVYGSVHSLMHANPSHTSDISE